jgi:hypothetical protein
MTLNDERFAAVDAVVAPDSDELEGAEDELAGQLEDELGDGAGDSHELEGFECQVWRLPQPGDQLPQGVKASQGIYLTRLACPVSMEQLKAIVGGGVFRLVFRGTGSDGRRRIVRRQVAIAGSRREPPSPGAADPAGSPGSDSRIDRLERMVEQLVNGVTRGAQPAAPDALEMFEKVARIMRTLSPSSGAMQPEQLFGLATDMFKRGVDLGSKGERGEDSWIDAIEKIGPIVKELIVARPRMMPPPGARAPRGNAAVVESPPAAAPAQSEARGDEQADRGVMLLETLGRAITRGTPPEQLAYTAEDMLNELELMRVRAMSADELVQLAGGRLRMLTTEQGRRYVERFLRALNLSPEERDEQDDEPEADPVATPSTE